MFLHPYLKTRIKILGTYDKCISVKVLYPCPRHFSLASSSAWRSAQRMLFPPNPKCEKRALPRESWAPSVVPKACTGPQKEGGHIPLWFLRQTFHQKVSIKSLCNEEGWQEGKKKNKTKINNENQRVDRALPPATNTPCSLPVLQQAGAL